MGKPTTPTMDAHTANADDPPLTREGPVPSTRRPFNRGKIRPYNRGRVRPRMDREPAYTKAVIPISLSMSPVKSYFAIYTSSNGVPRIAEVVYSCLQSRVKTLAHDITLPLFKYVISIAWFGRLIQVNKQLGMNMHIEATRLIEVAYAIPLPHLVCRYIETLGEYTMLSGAQLLPYCANYREMVPLGSEMYYDPLEALQEAGRPDPATDWSLDQEWIQIYIQAVGRFDQISVDFRTLTREYTGSAELLVGSTLTPYGLVPFTPERQTQAVGALGACYELRDYDRREDWPEGDNYMLSRVYSCQAVVPSLYIAQLFNNALYKE